MLPLLVNLLSGLFELLLILARPAKNGYEPISFAEGMEIVLNSSSEY
jgi:hypothetical protein